MLFEKLDIPDVVAITPRRHGDHRGYFSEIFRQDLIDERLGHIRFVQDNVSLSATKGTLRGLHYQTAPFAQGKLIRCLSGAILDVAVDIRKGSPTYGQHVAQRLDSENGKWLWIPEGFAHGLLTLEPDTAVLYKVTNYYSPECDTGILWNDPDLAIDWGVGESSVTLSDKDKLQPHLAAADTHFTFSGVGED